MTSPTARRTRRRRAAAVAAVAAALGVGLGTAPTAQAAAPAWSFEAAPVDQAALLAVAHVDSHTSWAVGALHTPMGKGSSNTPLLLSRDERDGHGWQRIATPLDGVEGVRLNALSAAAPDDVWVTGDADDTGIVTEHWDGAAWQVVRAPVQANNGAGLLGVATLSTTDAWAVGWATAADESGDFSGLLDHWDGTSWKAVPLPAGADVAVLNSVTAVSAQNVWAVGFDHADQPVLLHYDGAAWKRLPSPPIGGIDGELNAVTAHGADDVWAVGRVVVGERDSGHALALHWDGGRWRRVPAPAQAGPLAAVAATSDGVIAVGMDVPQDQGVAVRWGEDAVPFQTLPAPADGTVSLPAGVEVDGGAATVVGSIASYTSPDRTPLLLTGQL